MKPVDRRQPTPLHLPGWLFSLVQFFPLSLFAGYAFWLGSPTEQRWEEAFQLAAVAALVQLALLLPQRRPVNRLVLAGNLYLILGGAAFLTRQWWFLRLYDSLQESAIFIAMLLVGLVATFFSDAGYVAAIGAPRAKVMRMSWWLLGATGVALLVSVVFRGNRDAAAVVPIVCLALLQRLLMHRAGR